MEKETRREYPVDVPGRETKNAEDKAMKEMSMRTLSAQERELVCGGTEYSIELLLVESIDYLHKLIIKDLVIADRKIRIGKQN